MGKTPISGIVMGAVAIGLGVINVSSPTETPPASIEFMTYLLFGLGAIGLFGVASAVPEAEELILETCANAIGGTA